MSPTLRGFLVGLLVGVLGSVLAVALLGGPRIPRYAGLDRPSRAVYAPPTLKRGPDVPLGPASGETPPGDEPAAAATDAGAEGAAEGGTDDAAPDTAVPPEPPAPEDLAAGEVEDADYALFEGTLVAYRAAGAKDRHVAAPNWSLDGRYLTFAQTREGSRWDLYYCEVPYPRFGSKVRFVFPGDRLPLLPLTWHRDGILVVPGQGDADTRLFFAAPGGASLVELLPADRAPGNLADPTLTPDGKRLAFTSDAAGQQDVLQWDRTTEAVGPLIATADPEYAPAYSPDGRNIAWARELPGGSLILWKPLSGGEAQEVAFAPGDRVRPVWRDDDALAWYQGAGRQWTLEVVSLDGEPIRTISEVRLPVDRRVAVLPGRVLAYTGNEEAQDRAVMLLRPDWPHPVGVSTSQYAVGEPALVRRSGRVLVAYTGLDTPESRWRALYVADITHAVESPGPPR